MDANGPRTIRAAGNATSEQAGAEVNHPEGEPRARPPVNDAQDGSTANALRAPSPIDRAASQEGQHAQRRAVDNSDGAAPAGQTSAGTQANVPTVITNKHEQFREIVGKSKHGRVAHPNPPHRS